MEHGYSVFPVAVLFLDLLVLSVINRILFVFFLIN